MSADILDELELMRFTRIDPIRENAILKRAKDEIVSLRGEVEALRQCGVKYLGWLGVKDAENGLRNDMADPEMVDRPAPAMPNGVEARRHAANEWADMATNGVQWLRNIRAGISTADEALAEMESNLLRVRALNDEAQHMQLRAADNRDAAGVEALPPDGAYMIVYDDQDMRPETFARSGARDAALYRFEQISGNWNAHLYAKIRSNTRDVDVPDAAPAAVPAGEAVAPLGYVRRKAISAMREDDDVTGIMVHIEAPSDSVPVYLHPPAPVQAAPQEGEAYRPVRFGGIRRPSDEALAAAFWEHRQRENSLPADLCDSKLVKFGNDIVQRARELAPYLAAHPSACELGAVRELVARWRQRWESLIDRGRLGDGYRVAGNNVKLCADELEAALQHRGDSRGGEASGG